MRAPRDQYDVVAALMQPTADHAADRAGAVDDKPHARSLPHNELGVAIDAIGARATPSWDVVKGSYIIPMPPMPPMPPIPPMPPPGGAIGGPGGSGLSAMRHSVVRSMLAIDAAF